MAPAPAVDVDVEILDVVSHGPSADGGEHQTISAKVVVELRRTPTQ